MFKAEQIAANSWNIVDKDRRLVSSAVFYWREAAELLCGALNHLKRESSQIKGDSTALLRVLDNKGAE